jgi:hypothetical protein
MSDAIIVNGSYSLTRERLSATPTMTKFLAQDTGVADIVLMSNEELLKFSITDTAGGPSSGFMNAANRRFADWEKGHPAHMRYVGPLHIGAVAEVILAHRNDTNQARREALQLISESHGIDCLPADDATPQQIWTNLKAAMEAVGGRARTERPHPYGGGFFFTKPLPAP